MMRKRKYYVLVIICALLSGISKQSNAQTISDLLDDCYVGVGTGVQFSSMSFSDLDKDRFPTSEGTSSPIWSVFAQKEFGKQREFVVRPQLSFVHRGGKLTEIGKFKGYSDPDLKDVNYQLSSRYVDIRVPLLYQFAQYESSIRPYVGITPILGFSAGGNIRMQSEYKDCSVEGFDVELNSSNIASSYFALAPTAGVRFNIPFGHHGEHNAFVLLEACYEIGLSDTYSSKEKNGKAKNLIGQNNAKFDGTRKFSGFGLQAMVGIPLSVFKKKKIAEPEIEKPVTVIVEQIREPEKPCYTLEEISMMLDQHKDVAGKTICAISDINFDFGKSTLQKQSYPYLNQLAAMIIKTNYRIKVKGHTDNVGTDEFNLNLSRQRAETVMLYLIKQGVDKSKISYTYYGSSKPLSSNDTEEGRTMNRRVEFEIDN